MTYDTQVGAGMEYTQGSTCWNTSTHRLITRLNVTWNDGAPIRQIVRIPLRGARRGLGAVKPNGAEGNAEGRVVGDEPAEPGLSKRETRSRCIGDARCIIGPMMCPDGVAACNCSNFCGIFEGGRGHDSVAET